MASRVYGDTLRVWQFVHQYVRRRGFAPTVREMAEGCFMAKTAVDRALWKLAVEGVIEREERTARGIRLLQEPPPDPT